jgi:hypothetical protein
MKLIWKYWKLANQMKNTKKKVTLQNIEMLPHFKKGHATHNVLKWQQSLSKVLLAKISPNDFLIPQHWLRPTFKHALHTNDPYNYTHNFKENKDESLHVVTGLRTSKPKYKWWNHTLLNMTFC